MEPEGQLPTLNEDDALSLWVGRVARTHAGLEYNVNNVHRLLLQHAGLAPDRNSVKGFDQLVRECRDLLQRSDAGEEVQTSGDIALLAAKQVTSDRNRVVHDMWLPDPQREDWEPPRWLAFRRLGDPLESYASASSYDLAVIVETHTSLARTRLRVSGLFMALHATWRLDQDRDGMENLARYIALMMDRFAVRPNGDVDFT
jgi:hypothetical protein